MLTVKGAPTGPEYVRDPPPQDTPSIMQTAEKSCGNGPGDESAVITIRNVTGSPTCGAEGLSETERTAQSVARVGVVLLPTT